jgi:hypothetical protein
MPQTYDDNPGGDTSFDDEAPQSDQGAGGSAALEYLVGQGDRPPPRVPPKPNWTEIANNLPTWNQGDEIDLQRLQNGAGYIRNQSISGRWGPQTTSFMTDQLNEQLGPMMQKKQQAVQFQKQQAKQEAMDQNATQSAMAIHDTGAAMSALPEQLQYIPMAHGTMVLGPDGKGGVQQFDTPEAPETTTAGGGGDQVDQVGPPAPGEDQGAGGQAQQPDLAADGQPYGDQARYSVVRGPDGVARQQRIPTAAEHAAMQAATPEQQMAIADRIGNGTFGTAAPQPDQGPMSIQSGPFRDVYQGGRLTSTNRPPPPQAGAGANRFLPSAEQLQAMHVAADAAVAHIQNPRYRELERARILGGMVHAFSTNAIHRQDAEDRATAAQKHQDFVTAQADRKEQAKAHKDQQEKDDQEFFKQYKVHEKALEDRITDARKKHGPDADLSGILGGRPETTDYLKHRGLAHDMAVDDVRKLRPGYQSPEQRAAPPPGPPRLRDDEAKAFANQYQKISAAHGAAPAADVAQRERQRQRTEEDLKRTGLNPTGGGISPWRIFGD